MTSYNARMRAKMYNPPLSQEENKIWKDNFVKNQQFVQSVRNLNKPNGNPILQREDAFIPKTKTIQPCNINYFDRVKKQERPKSRPVNRTINPCFQETINLPHKPTHKKIFPNGPEREVTSNRPVQKKYFPERNKKSIMDDIVNRQHNYPEVPEKYKYHIKIKPDFNKPSEELVRMNNRGKLLPCEQNGETNKSNNLMVGQKYQYNKEILRDTKNSIFGNNDKNNNTTKNRYVHKIELKDKTDNVRGIISYQYAPQYRDMGITDKPTHNDYNSLINQNFAHFREDFVLQSY